MGSRQAVIGWLLDSDPSIRWQVMRNLLNEPDEAVAAERSRVASAGWGAQLLALQSPPGQWGAGDDEGWMTTVDALALLKNLGIDPASEEALRAVGLVRERITWWQLDGRPFFDGETEACINGRILAAGVYFGSDCKRLVDRLLVSSSRTAAGTARLSRARDIHSIPRSASWKGSWNMRERKGPSAVVTEARARAQDYLLERRMLRSLTSGEVIDRRWTRFAFSTMYHYDVLRGLDYLRSAGVEPDERVAEAIELVEKRRHQNGRWPLNRLYPSRIPLAMETAVGSASRWNTIARNTLRALRVLDWYRSEARSPN